MLKEECGVFGIYNSDVAAQLTYLGLYALQHRGQESAGIISYNKTNDVFHAKKGNGLVSRVFDKNDLKELIGMSAIGHVRYSTTGEDNNINIQPLMVKCVKGTLAIAHNGNLTNSKELYDELRQNGAIFQTTLDTEVVLHLVAKSKKEKLEDAIVDALTKIKGSFSMVFLTKNYVIAARDAHGVRPLVLGELNEQYVVASETCALDLIGAKYVREIEPGEVLFISKYGLKSRRFAEKEKKLNHCIFEYIYFSRPDSILFGQSVYEIQKKLGARLAQESPADADLVIAVPDSGNSAAIGYSEKSHIPFEIGLMRNHYIGRTFIQNSQIAREIGVKIKLSPIKHVLKGKKVIVIDDSLVRGTTSKKIVKMLRKAGAKEIHLRISSPPYKHSCFYGVDTPSVEHLVAHNNSVKDIQEYLGVDSLAYISLDGVLDIVTEKQLLKSDDFCTACFSGDYKIPLYSLNKLGKGVLEKK